MMSNQTKRFDCILDGKLRQVENLEEPIFPQQTNIKGISIWSTYFDESGNIYDDDILMKATGKSIKTLIGDPNQNIVLYDDGSLEVLLLGSGLKKIVFKEGIKSIEGEPQIERSRKSSVLCLSENGEINEIFCDWDINLVRAECNIFPQYKVLHLHNLYRLVYFILVNEIGDKSEVIIKFRSGKLRVSRTFDFPVIAMSSISYPDSAIFLLEDGNVYHVIPLENEDIWITVPHNNTVPLSSIALRYQYRKGYTILLADIFGGITSINYQSQANVDEAIFKHIVTDAHSIVLSNGSKIEKNRYLRTKRASD